MTTYSQQQLADLWTQAGGSPQAAKMAAAIAMAESGGRSDASNTNTNGTVDRGLWQINSIHGSLSTFDPMANARAAVSISKNGTTWRPWCTAWSNGRCGGTYLGVGSPVLKYLGAAVTNAANSVTGLTGSEDIETLGFGNPLSPQTWANAFLAPLGTWAWYGLMAVIGIVLCTYATGLFVAVLLVKSGTPQAVLSLIVSGATKRPVQVSSKPQPAPANPPIQAKSERPGKEIAETDSDIIDAETV